MDLCKFEASLVYMASFSYIVRPWGGGVDLSSGLCYSMGELPRKSPGEEASGVGHTCTFSVQCGKHK